MIEKIMRAVKSGNKKRGINITIGTVVGFLLSCTTVMGEDNYLWIKNDGGIKFSTDNSISLDADNPYDENTWNGIDYINNITLSGTNNLTAPDSDGYGLRLSEDLGSFNFINNGVIIGTGNDFGHGIYNSDGSITTLVNSGLISGTGNDEGSGIKNYGGSSIETLTNSGLITGTGNDNVYGIYNFGSITTLANSGLIIGTGDIGGYGIYNYYDSIGTLTNSGLITGIGNGSSYGISNEGGSITTLVNSGLIIGTWNNNGYGISNEGGSMTTLVNSGLITGIGSDLSYGIYNSGSITTLVNSGLIIGIGDIGSYGIANYDDNIGTLTNSGLIIGIGDIGGYGIDNDDDSIGTLTNSGLIIGTGDSSYGIYNGSSIRTLTNTGVIFGTTSAIKNDRDINSAYNYGIMANGNNGKEVLEGLTVVDGTPNKNEILNKGLIFKAVGGNYIATENDYNQFGKIYENEDVIIDSKNQQYTVINAKTIGIDKDNITGTESLTLEDGKLTYYNSKESSYKEESISLDKKYILNGITDTLKVAGAGNELNNSAVNAYKTAVVMDKDMSTLTLNDTTVSGGVLEGSAVNISGNGNTLAVQENSTINSNATAITVGGNNNAVTLEGNARVNGKMESTGNNTLNLNGNAENGMNMLHNISGFVNMNIENNVTFFENIKVTGTDTVTVDKNGVLSLRLKKQDTTTYNTIPTAVHAFSERDGKHDMIIKGTSQEDAGTLNFITNGIGREIYVDMENIKLENMKIKANSIIDSAEIHDDYIHLGAGSDLSGIVNPRVSKYDSLNKIYKSVYNSREENIDALRNILAMTFIGKHYGYNNATDEEQLKTLMSYLNSIYTETPYSYSSELSRRSMGMFRDIVTENHFRPELNKWMIMGGLTHADGGTKDSYYGQNYHGIDMDTAETDVDMKLTGAYALGKYRYSENVSLGVAVGGNRSEAEMSMSKVKGDSGYIGAFAENYRGNLTLKAGAGIQYSEYDADRATLGGHSYDEKYSDMAYDIYLNGRYSHNIGDNLFLEPYGTLSYTYIKQDGANEGSKALAIEIDSKLFDYTSAKVGVDLKKVISHEKGKSTLSAGVSYTRLLNGVDEEYITGRFKGENASDFDILVAHKNEHSLGLNAKYTLELENGVLLDVKGTYAVERDSHNGAGKNKTKGEWIVGAGLGYKF